MVIFDKYFRIFMHNGKDIFLSVIIPCFNEAKNIEAGNLEEVYTYLQNQDFSWELIIAEDGPHRIRHAVGCGDGERGARSGVPVHVLLERSHVAREDIRVVRVDTALLQARVLLLVRTGTRPDDGELSRKDR